MFRLPLETPRHTQRRLRGVGLRFGRTGPRAALPSEVFERRLDFPHRGVARLKGAAALTPPCARIDASSPAQRRVGYTERVNLALHVLDEAGRGGVR